MRIYNAVDTTHNFRLSGLKSCCDSITKCDENDFLKIHVIIDDCDYFYVFEKIKWQSTDRSVFKLCIFKMKAVKLATLLTM